MRALMESILIFLSNDGEERVLLLLTILQTEQTLSFPASAVRKNA